MTQAARDRLARALELLGDQWTLLILQQAFFGVRRFNDWRDILGISEAVLSPRLRSLVEAGVFYRRPYRDHHRTRSEYRLTDAGLDLWSVLVAIWAWEYQWVPGRREELPELLHSLCRESCQPTLGCAHCGESVTARDTTAHRDPQQLVRDATPPRRFRRSGWESVSGRPELFFPETMTIIGDRWSTALTAAALLGNRRFSEFERELGIRPSILSQRLSQLRELGVLARQQEHGRQAVIYRLTEKGLAFYPVFALIIAWADQWFDDQPRSLRVEHRACSQTLVPRLYCDRCGVKLERSQIQFGHPELLRSSEAFQLPTDRPPSPTAR